MASKKMKYCLLLLFALMMICAKVASAERLAVSVSVANIRSGPGTKFNVLWQVEKYYPLSILRKSGPWYYFQDFEGDQGWIHQSLIGKISSIITKNEKSNIRSGPSTSSKILFSVEKGIPFKILTRKGSWIHIQHADGDKGWIHKSLVW